MATFSRLPQTVPPPAFDPSAFAGGLAPEQAKLFRSLGRNVKGDYAGWAKNAGLGGDLAGGFQKWLNQRAPVPRMSGPISSHPGGEFGPKGPIIPKPLPRVVSPPGMPPPPRTISPPGPGNLPPRSISPPGMPPLPAKRPSLRAMKGGSVSTMGQSPSLQALRGY